jgi:hypothetical protein
MMGAFSLFWKQRALVSVQRSMHHRAELCTKACNRRSVVQMTVQGIHRRVTLLWGCCKVKGPESAPVIFAELVSRYSSSVAWKKQRYWMIVMNLDWVLDPELSFI